MALGGLGWGLVLWTGGSLQLGLDWAAAGWGTTSSWARTARETASLLCRWHGCNAVAGVVYSSAAAFCWSWEIWVGEGWP